MNEHKQSKSSIVFQTCWLAGWKGAKIEDIDNALYEAGYNMPIDSRLMPMLKTYLRKGQIKLYKNKWIVEKPFSPS